jgi:hypothetical protein
MIPFFKVEIVRLPVARHRCSWTEMVIRANTARRRTDSKSFSLFSRSKVDNLASSWGERGCISCRAAPRNGSIVMCQPCHDRALRVAPVIIEVPEDHENFKNGWR